MGWDCESGVGGSGEETVEILRAVQDALDAELRRRAGVEDDGTMKGAGDWNGAQLYLPIVGGPKDPPHPGHLTQQIDGVGHCLNEAVRDGQACFDAEEIGLINEITIGIRGEGDSE